MKQSETERNMRIFHWLIRNADVHGCLCPLSLSLRMWALAIPGIMEVNGIKGITRQWKSIPRIIPSIMNFTLSRKTCRVLSLVMVSQLLIFLSLKF